MSGLWEHQRHEVDEHWSDPARALWFEPRTGKTRTTVEQVRRLIDERGVNRILVVGPIMALRMSWVQELRTLGVATYDLTQGKLADRAKTLQGLRPYEDCPLPRVVLVNYEALKALEPALLKWAPQVVIADEAHLIKSPSAIRTRAMVKLGKQAAYRRALTGTPTPRSYTDLYAQFLFLDPTIFGTSKKRFENELCWMHPQWRSKVVGYKLK